MLKMSIAERLSNSKFAKIFRNDLIENIQKISLRIEKKGGKKI